MIRRNLLKLLALCPFLRFSPTLWAQSVSLREQITPGQRFRIQAKSDLSGSMVGRPEKPSDPVQKIRIQGDSLFDFEETILALDNSQKVVRTLRDYRKATMKRVLNQVQEEISLRPELKRLVLVRNKSREIAFSPDEPLHWSEVDLLQTEVFPCSLAGLLPNKDAMLQSTWQPDTTSMLELTDLETIREQQVQCKLESKGLVNNRSLARVTFAGKVLGIHEDGPNQQMLDGFLFFDTETMHISYMQLKGTSIMLGENGVEVGRMEGKFQLHREVLPAISVTAELLAATMPTPLNTRFLFEQPGMPFSFTYPRPWKVATAFKNQVALEHPEGASLLLARLDASGIPDVHAYKMQAREYFEKDRATIENETAISSVTENPEWNCFSWRVTQAQKREHIHYYFRAKPVPISLALRYSEDGSNFRSDAMRIALAVKTS